MLILALVLLAGRAYAADLGVPDAVKVAFYGYVKVDLSYDNSLSSHGNFIMFVKPHPRDNTTSTLNLTARQTRMGINVARGKAKGRFEIDFYGGGLENKNHMVLRHAYVDIPLGNITLCAGQASDIISPLVPSTLNYTVGWGAGNIGYRRPLIQISSTNNPLHWAVSIARSIGSDLNGDSVIDGEAADVPTVQGRFGLDQGKAAMGISGHYGLMSAPGTADEDYCSWSANIDAKLSLSSAVTLLAEAYIGVNTGTYFGAILNGDCVHDLQSRGGWVNLQLNPKGTLAFSLGGGIDDLNDEFRNYIAATEDVRIRNAFLFGNVTYTIQSNVKTGIELSRWQTKYANPSAGIDPEPTDVRLQWSIQSSF